MSAVLLLLLGLLDAAFAGFRASSGRDGRIRRAAGNRRAALRGLAHGTPGLLAAAAVAGAVLLGSDDPAARYRELDEAGLRMLVVYGPYSALVLGSLACYLVGPFRLSTLAMIIGLGPLTLLRPPVVVAGAVAAAWQSLPAAVVALTAGVAVLLVEPVVHRRWYTEPL
ncbi:hypothetical protein [Kitasatospora sp. NPDC088548]|uniref:hypothetical protein n=1 Tax=Kitasatospora sp. NPDC088548 TaxID=3364075 RepID=UPI00381F7161